MTVYVSQLVDHVPDKDFKWKKKCRLFADTDKELDKIASALRLSPLWLHAPTGEMPYYLLTPSGRQRAIAKGAKRRVVK